MATNHNGHSPKKKPARKKEHPAHEFERKLMALVGEGISNNVSAMFMAVTLTKAREGLVMAHTIATIRNMVSTKKN